MKRKRSYSHRLFNLRDVEELSDRQIRYGYSVSKWLLFTKYYIKKGCEVYVKQTRETRSKYITVSKSNVSVKVRFSEHAPIERMKDSDLYVGPKGITARQAAIEINRKLDGIETPE